MELGANITAKLEPFLLMSKAAKGAAAAKLIENATSAAGVFVFAELLEQPNIQEVCHLFLSLGRLTMIQTGWCCYLCLASEQRATCAALRPAATLRIQDISGLSSLGGTCNSRPHSFSLSRLEHKDSLPSLNQAQITKLKHLSLVSLAMDSRVGLTEHDVK